MMPSNIDWQASAAYAYILHLDSTSLAWEYLRRSSEYRHHWDFFRKCGLEWQVSKWRLQFRRRSRHRLARRTTPMATFSGERRYSNRD